MKFLYLQPFSKSTVCKGDIFQFSIKICKHKSYNSNYNHYFAHNKIVFSCKRRSKYNSCTLKQEAKCISAIYISFTTFCSKELGLICSYYLSLALQRAKIVKQNIIIASVVINELGLALQSIKFVKRNVTVAFMYFAHCFRAQWSFRFTTLANITRCNNFRVQRL